MSSHVMYILTYIAIVYDEASYYFRLRISAIILHTLDSTVWI